REVFHVGFCQVVVTQNGRKGEEEEDEGDQVCTPVANLIGQRHLGQGNAFGFAAVFHVGAQQNNEGGNGTNHERVKVNAQGLHQSLLDGVGYRCRCCRVRSRTFTSFVGKEATLDALHHGRTQACTSDLLEAKSMRDDVVDDGWYSIDIGDDHVQTDDQVSDRHEWNNHLGHACNALDATEDDKAGYNCDDQANDRTEGEAVISK